MRPARAMQPWKPRAMGSSAGWTPLALGSKLTAWYDDRNLIQAGGDYSGWGPDFARGRFMVVAGSPPASGSTLGGYAAASFDELNSAFTSFETTVADYISSTAFFVRLFWSFRATAVAPGDGPAEDVVLGETGTAWTPLSLSTSGVQCSVNSGAPQSTSRIVVAADTAYRSVCQLSAGVLSMRTGGTNATSATGVGTIASLSGDVRIAQRDIEQFDGTVGGMVICNAALTAAERSQLDTYDALTRPLITL